MLRVFKQRISDGELTAYHLGCRHSHRLKDPVSPYRKTSIEHHAYMAGFYVQDWHKWYEETYSK